jgi:hypothetical protein
MEIKQNKRQTEYEIDMIKQTIAEMSDDIKMLKDFKLQSERIKVWLLVIMVMYVPAYIFAMSVFNTTP